MKLGISAVVLTLNEEDNIARTIRSMRDLFGEIIVVDSGSTDRTVSIAQSLGAEVIFRKYRDHADQWRWVFEAAPLRFEWVFLVDADFEFTETLITSLRAEFSRLAENCLGIYVEHRYVFRGRHIRFGGTKHWWLRLVHRRAARIDDSELVDFRVSVMGRTDRLRGMILEKNAKEDKIDFWIDKHQKFSSRLAVEEVLKAEGTLAWDGQSHSFWEPEGRRVQMKKVWAYLPKGIRPVLYFLFRYLFLLGFLDGWEGFHFHFLQAFWFRLIVDLKIDELNRSLAAGETSLQKLRDSYCVSK